MIIKVTKCKNNFADLSEKQEVVFLELEGEEILYANAFAVSKVKFVNLAFQKRKRLINFIQMGTFKKLITIDNKPCAFMETIKI